MAVKSMTGYGTGTARNPLLRVEIEISSVNRKQLDVALRLPPLLAAHESYIQKRIQSVVSRGRISGTITLRTETKPQVRIDREQAKATVEALRYTARQLGLEEDLSASVLLQIPGLISVEQEPLRQEELRGCLDAALDAALNRLDAMRRQEGRALAADFRARLRLLASSLKKIKARRPAVISALRDKLTTGLAATGFAAIATDERVLKEIALHAERSDIAEEITRIESHLQQFNDLLRGEDSPGRTLDFLAQELLREINTIASKANDLSITNEAVQFKTELDRIREQIQNVE